MISVIIPSYNRSNILIRAINSVLSQTYESFEIIVVDDGSIDDTKSVVLSLNDHRIRYIYQENKGVCAARNYGASLASNDYIVFLDSDDYVTTDWLENFYKIILEKSPDFVFCDMKLLDYHTKSEKIVKALDPYNQGIIIKNGLYLSGTFCVRLSFYKSVGGLDENLKFAEFTDFGFSSNQKNPTKFFSEKLGLIYEAATDGGSKNSQNKIEANLYIIKKHSTLFKKNPHVLRLYYQNIGVAYVRLCDFTKARFFFWKAYWIQPWKIKTLARFFISLNPNFAKKIIK